MMVGLFCYRYDLTAASSEMAQLDSLFVQALPLSSVSIDDYYVAGGSTLLLLRRLAKASCTGEGAVIEATSKQRASNEKQRASSKQQRASKQQATRQRVHRLSPGPCAGAQGSPAARSVSKTVPALSWSRERAPSEQVDRPSSPNAPSSRWLPAISGGVHAGRACVHDWRRFSC